MTDLSFVHDLTREQANTFYDEFLSITDWPDLAQLGREDRFFLLTRLLHRQDADRDWLYERCREVERDPDNHIDLWAREHYKSTIITFAGVIQEILKNPEITVSIFSHNQSTASKFLKQIKQEFEDNNDLKRVYPGILWAKPERQAPTWSEYRGIIVKRKSNPKEATVEAHGLVDGMPTGMHYRLRVYDDTVTQDSVTTPEMMQKTTDAWRLSHDLGTEGGRMWHIGTRYHFNDTYKTILDLGDVIPRIYPATDDGTATGNPVLFDRKFIEDKRKKQGPYIFSCQQLQNPVADKAQGFKVDWLRHTFHDGDGTNRYILCDPANEKKKHSDYTVFWVVGAASDRNFYIVDVIRDRLNLTERGNCLFDLHRQYYPLGVGYEKYGKDSDIQHFEYRMEEENYRFDITPLGGNMKKEDRIRRLVPLFENGKIYLPEVLYRTNYEGKNEDLIRVFIENEYKGFPVSTHDDMLDSLSRILDPEMNVQFPIGEATEYKKPDRYNKPPRSQGTWMSAL